MVIPARTDLPVVIVRKADMGGKMTKEKLALEIIERLKKEYPDAG